jgi:hypothetical protein
MRRTLLLIFSLGLFLGWSMSDSCPAVPLLDNCFMLRARAQGGARAVLYPADASAFPVVSTFMDVFDATDRFVSGLMPEQVTVLEDGQALPVSRLTEMVVPLQLVTAINPGPALATRDKQGLERFEAIVNELSTWAQALPADTPDDMSLVTLSGPIISHASARDWLVSLQAFRPDFLDSTPNLQTLQIAIETVSVQAPRVGMKRAVFFITPHMDDADVESQVAPLIERAIQNNVRVFVWFADTELFVGTASATAFTNLALQTGGAYFAATELQPYPDPESYFAPLRRLYALQFDSAATVGGSHTVSVQVAGPAGTITSSEQPFSIDIQPPNPIFVSPQLQIVRSPPEDDPYSTKVLLPADQHLDIIIEFPDGHPRPLRRTTLYVDGQIAAENTVEPFDSFTWDLSGYTVSGEHKIVAEVQDSFDQTRASIEIPVTVTVIQPPRGVAAIFARYRQSIIIGAVALAAFVLIMILFAGRLRLLFAGARSAREELIDPLTQPIPARRQVPANRTKKTIPRRTATKPRSKAVEAPAFLRRLQPDPLAEPGAIFKPAPGDPIPLAAAETTFGTDPKQSSCVLDDPSVEALHARILQAEGGKFSVRDAGTIGGTWVNFEPVGAEPHLLEHGDVIHFGQLVFRFELRDAPSPAQPKVTKTPSPE